MKKRASGVNPSFTISLIPILFLIAALVFVIITKGASAVSEISQPILLSATSVALILSYAFYPRKWKILGLGVLKSAKQILPAMPILVLIATVSATWMFGGVVPSLIYYGLSFLQPQTFLVVACLVCSVISVLTGSSWTTCATIGIAFIGIGTIMGYDIGWIAGAVISGAYFGDKISPLSDTTVLASSTAGVKLFEHIKYLMITTLPALVITLIVFLIVGFNHSTAYESNDLQLINNLQQTFHISPWLLIVPLLTCCMIVLRINVLITLSISTLIGLVCLLFSQPQVLLALSGTQDVTMWGNFTSIIGLLFTSTTIETGDELLNNLVSTGGIFGMWNTLYLILSAMLFGGVMLGSGMLSSITHHGLRKLKGRTRIISATVGSGLMLNSCTGDQYLSLILGGNLYKNLYKKNGLKPKLLGRTLEDSISVTSVLIPWNSCGMTQATVLGVPTLTYLPYCIFNYLCPLMSIFISFAGYKIVYKIKSYQTSLVSSQ